ncbi:MAG: hypothetical protein ACM309_00605 [Bacillota bacterium]
MRRVITYLMVAILAVAALALLPAAAWAQEAEPPAASEAVIVKPLELAQEGPDYKAMYFATLQRNLELEAELAERDKIILELRDLALGYRSDWEAERRVAEARQAETDKVIEIGKMLLDIIRDMKDTINKQHEIIMTLTQPKKMGIQLIGGAVVHPREPTNPGVLFALGWQF